MSPTTPCPLPPRPACERPQWLPSLAIGFALVAMLDAACRDDERPALEARTALDAGKSSDGGGGSDAIAALDTGGADAALPDASEPDTDASTSLHDASTDEASLDAGEDGDADPDAFYGMCAPGATVVPCACEFPNAKPCNKICEENEVPGYPHAAFNYAPGSEDSSTCSGGDGCMHFPTLPCMDLVELNEYLSLSPEECPLAYGPVQINYLSPTLPDGLCLPICWYYGKGQNSQNPACF